MTEQDRLEGRVRLLSIEQHKKMVQKLLGDMPISFIRDFAVIDSSNHPRLGKSPVIIYHLRSGLWRGFTFTFDQALHALAIHPEKDEELILVLHEV